MVTIKYSPVKWAQAHNDETATLANYDNFLNKSEKRSESPTKIPASHYYNRRRHLQPLSSLGFQKPTQDSINSMKNYLLDAKKNEVSFIELEKNWYGDLINVGQRLKLLRDAYKVIQAVRKKKALGIKVDFRPIYDTKASRNDSPAHLDDESRPHKTDDEDEYKVREYPPPTRRGRPRKKRGRERKLNVGRGDARAAAVTRTRVSRRQLDRSALPQAPTPRRNAADRGTTPLSLSSVGPLTSVKTEQSSLALSPPQALQLILNLAPSLRDPQPFGPSQPILIPEPQGPPLMYLPPILPSQRHHLIHGIPPYRHMKEIEAGMSLGGAAVDGAVQNLPTYNSIGKSYDVLNPADSPMVELNFEQKSMHNVSDTKGPGAAELSDVFKQLAEGQTYLPSQSKPEIPIVAHGNTVLPSIGASLTATPLERLNNTSETTSRIPNGENIMNASTHSQNTQTGYNNSSTDMDPSFNGNWVAPKENAPAQSNKSSDRSFINRLLN